MTFSTKPRIISTWPKRRCFNAHGYQDNGLRALLGQFRRKEGAVFGLPRIFIIDIGR